MTGRSLDYEMKSTLITTHGIRARVSSFNRWRSTGISKQRKRAIGLRPVKAESPSVQPIASGTVCGVWIPELDHRTCVTGDYIWSARVIS
jgi:hypothetical protein